jgi:hypothetical protein
MTLITPASTLWQGQGRQQQGRQRHQQQQQDTTGQPVQRAGDAHDWVRQTVLEEQPFHAATLPNYSRAR